MKTLCLLQILLFSIFVSDFKNVSARIVPGSLMKVASNNMYGIPMSRLVARGMLKRGVENNESEDYYELEDNCPQGFIFFLRNGECVPEKCGIGAIRDHVTGQCSDVDNNVPIIANYMDNPPSALYGRPPFKTRSNIGGNKGHKTSKILRGLAIAHGAL